MCGEYWCGLHPGVGTNGQIAMLQKLRGFDPIPVPSGLQGPLNREYQFEREFGLDKKLYEACLARLQKLKSSDPIPVPSGLQEPLNREYPCEHEFGLDVNFNLDCMVLSFTDIQQGNVSYWELVKLHDERWAALHGDADPSTIEDCESHGACLFVDDVGSDPTKPNGLLGCKYGDTPLLTADQKVATRINKFGFFRCRNWPIVLQSHPELRTFHEIAIQCGWLALDGSHPNWLPAIARATRVKKRRTNSRPEEPNVGTETFDKGHSTVEEELKLAEYSTIELPVTTERSDPAGERSNQTTTTVKLGDPKAYEWPDFYELDKWIYDNIWTQSHTDLSVNYKIFCSDKKRKSSLSSRNAFKNRAKRFADFNRLPHRNFSGEKPGVSDSVSDVSDTK